MSDLQANLERILKSSTGTEETPPGLVFGAFYPKHGQEKYVFASAGNTSRGSDQKVCSLGAQRDIY